MLRKEKIRMGKINMFVAVVIGTLMIILTACDDSPRPSEATPVRTDTADRAQAEPSAQPSPVAHPQRQPGEFLELVPPTRDPQQMILVCSPTDHPPTVDGKPDDAAWQRAPAITTLDYSSQRPITVQAVHTADEIFMMVTFPDAAPSETHKSWVWDPHERVYKMGDDREDVLVLKWSMVGNDVDLSFHDAEPHTADIWFWKACRTNPAGYLDDKSHVVVSDPSEEKKLPIPSKRYGQLYLQRNGDAGEPAYIEEVPSEYLGDVLGKYRPRPPEGSRADVRGKGVWDDGRWVIEIRRKLDTGHEDDLSMKVGGEYLFAVCCYEMAATGINHDWTQPLYRTGDAFDRLLLKIE